MVDNKDFRQLEFVRTLQLYDDSAEWVKNNPIILPGEMAVESDTNRFKIGNGNRYTLTDYPYMIDKYGEGTLVTGDTRPNMPASKNIIDYLSIYNDIIYPITLTDAVRFKNNTTLTSWVNYHGARHDNVFFTTGPTVTAEVNRYTKVCTIKLTKDRECAALSLRLLGTGNNNNDTADLAIRYALPGTAAAGGAIADVTISHISEFKIQFDVFYVANAVNATKESILDIYLKPKYIGINTVAFELANDISEGGFLAYYNNSPYITTPEGAVEAGRIGNAHLHPQYAKLDATTSFTNDITYTMNGITSMPISSIISASTAGSGYSTEFGSNGYTIVKAGRTPLIGNKSDGRLFLSADSDISIILNDSARLQITSNGNLLPTANNITNLGSPTNQWANVHAITFSGALSGNASTASKLATARSINLTGSVTGAVSFDGSGNVSIDTTTNHIHKQYAELDGSAVFTNNIKFTDSGTTHRGITGINNTGSYRVGGSATSAGGNLELATGGTGNESIIVKQFVGQAFTTLKRELTILDASGNTIIPGELSEAGTLLKNKYSAITHLHDNKYAIIAHTHTKSSITDFPTSMQANGGNADTIGGKSPSDFCPTPLFLKNISIPISAWNRTNRTFEYANASIDTTMSPDVRFSENTIDAATFAQIIAYTAAGKLILKARENIPTSALTMEVVIFTKIS